MSMIASLQLQWPARGRESTFVSDVLSLVDTLLELGDAQAVPHLDSVVDLTSLVLLMEPRESASAHRDALLLRAEALLAIGDVQAASNIAQHLLTITDPDRVRTTLGKSPHHFGGVGSVPTVSPTPLDPSSPSVLLIDSFVFNGEAATLARLEATAHLFDAVYVLESWYPLSPTLPKKSRLFVDTPFWVEVFARFGPKVRIAELHSITDPPVSWMVFWLTTMTTAGYSFPTMDKLTEQWRQDSLRDAVLRVLPTDGTPYILFVSNVDEVPSPTQLHSGFFRDRVAAYNALNHDGHGFRYLEMVTLVYGLAHRTPGTHSRGFVVTDRVVQGLAKTAGHLASLSAIRLQVIGPMQSPKLSRGVVANAGWHLTHLCSPVELVQLLGQRPRWPPCGEGTHSVTDMVLQCLQSGVMPAGPPHHSPGGDVVGVAGPTLVPVHHVVPPEELAEVVGPLLQGYLQGAVVLPVDPSAAGTPPAPAVDAQG